MAERNARQELLSSQTKEDVKPPLWENGRPKGEINDYRARCGRLHHPQAR